MTTFKFIPVELIENKYVSDNCKAVIDAILNISANNIIARRSGYVVASNKQLRELAEIKQNYLIMGIIEAIDLGLIERKAGEKWVKGKKRMASIYRFDYERLKQPVKRMSNEELFANFKLSGQSKQEQPKMELPQPYQKKEQPKPESNKMEETPEPKEEQPKSQLPESLDAEGKKIAELLPDSISEIGISLADKISSYHYCLTSIDDKNAFEQFIDDKYGKGSMTRIYRRSIEATNQQTERNKKIKEQQLHSECLEFGGVFDNLN